MPTSWRPMVISVSGARCAEITEIDVAVDALEGDPVGVADAPLDLLAGELAALVADGGGALVDRGPLVGAPRDRRRAGVLAGRAPQRVAGRRQEDVVAVGHLVVGDEVGLVAEHRRGVGLEVEGRLAGEQVGLGDPDDARGGGRERRGRRARRRGPRGPEAGDGTATPSPPGPSPAPPDRRRDGAREPVGESGRRRWSTRKIFLSGRRSRGPSGLIPPVTPVTRNASGLNYNVDLFLGCLVPRLGQPEEPDRPSPSDAAAGQEVRPAPRRTRASCARCRASRSCCRSPAGTSARSRTTARR